MNEKPGKSFEVECYMIKEGEYHIAYNPTFNLSSHSTDEAKAQQGMVDAIILYLEHWEKLGLLKEKLAELKDVTQPEYSPNSMAHYLLQLGSFKQQRIAVPA